VLRLDDDWAWDFWLADDGDAWHLFFLRAPRSLGDPNLRHWNVRIGHAVSDDLHEWHLLPDAFGPSPEAAFDDYTTWTGSVVRSDDGTWYMFYTGSSRAEQGLRQRIGVATSTDLVTWRKRGPTALVESDRRWYEQLGESDWSDEAWRDPWVFRDPNGDGWHMLITARGRNGPPDERGVIGHARSADLIRWEVLPPRSVPGSGFGHLEVPQAVMVDGRPLLVFSCLTTELSAGRQAAGEGGGIWLLEPDDLLGPYDVRRARRLTNDRLYSGRLIQQRDGTWVLLGFHHDDADGRFVGWISDPIPLVDHRLTIDPVARLNSA
jgi:beta-fructofuranosidase